VFSVPLWWILTAQETIEAQRTQRLHREDKERKDNAEYP